MQVRGRTDLDFLDHGSVRLQRELGDFWNNFWNSTDVIKSRQKAGCPGGTEALHAGAVPLRGSIRLLQDPRAQGQRAHRAEWAQCPQRAIGVLTIAKS